MKLNQSEAFIVSDGTFKMDGGSIFGVVPKTIWGSQMLPDQHNCVDVALKCILIKHLEKHILIDTGIGTKSSPKSKQILGIDSGYLLENLKNHNLEPSDIDMVILTHLHFDHVGGCTAYDSSGKLYNVFSKALHFTQKLDWDEATILNGRTKAAYDENHFVPLYENQQLELLRGDTELLPGLKLHLTGGHTAGHQMITLSTDDYTLATLGDILPTEHHIPNNYITAFDINPIETSIAKSRWLDIAEKEQWILSFNHSTSMDFATLQRDVDDKLYVKPTVLLS
jgi:glyoxylase-like metal-dependent hydrolase (beta-lactamase superfamily II)